MRKVSKRIKKLRKKFGNKSYEINDGLSLLYKAIKEGKEEAIDIAINLNVDTRHADQQLRGALNLPNGGFKTKRVLVFSDDVDKQELLDLGATYVGKDEYIEKFNQGWLDFDIMIAHPTSMKDLAKFGRILGPKGLMPNPKLGTVATDVKKALVDIVKGRAEYRTDKGGILHVQIGKTSMEKDKVAENFEFFLTNIKRLRPATVKGDFIKSIYISTTQSPSIKISADLI